jgi:16S rRNA (guanine(966)-N(2))-methyltransferase RsmD
VGVEAASRGADQVLLVEGDGRKKGTILENISFVETDIQLIIMQVERFLHNFDSEYYYIFLDPPFNYKNKEKLLATISEKKLVHPDGSVLLHHPSEDRIPDRVENLIQYKIKTYGRSVLRYYRLSVV